VIDETVRRLDLLACVRREICSTDNCQDRAYVTIRYVRYGPSEQSSFCFRHTLGDSVYIGNEDALFRCSRAQ
jgi:hypothetical protein